MRRCVMKRRKKLHRPKKTRVAKVEKTTNITAKLMTLFSFVLLLMGFLYGILMFKEFGDLLSPSLIDDEILNHYDRPDPSVWVLVRGFFEEFSYFLILWFLSMTIIGIIVVVFSLFFIGFLYGFTLWFFISEYGSDGLTIGLLYTFPKNIIILPFMIYFTTAAIRGSLRIFSALYVSQNKKTFQLCLVKYINLLLFAMGVVLIYTLTDAIVQEWIGDRLKSLL